MKQNTAWADARCLDCMRHNKDCACMMKCVHELDPIPLDKILAEVKDLIAKGYNPLHFLSKLKIDDNGGRLRKD